MAKPIVLMILDGWGIGERHQGNPITQVPTPTFDWAKKNFPSLALQASGINVGLPWGEEGNSEAGHLTLGAGRILYQHYPRITMAIRDGSFFKNQAFLAAFENAKRGRGRVHLLGLLSRSNVHASFEHLEALITFAKEEKVTPLLHLFTDGRDGPPQDAKKMVARVEETCKNLGVGKIVSLAGRFYAMDRDAHWDRTEQVFRLLTEGGKTTASAVEAIETAYQRGLVDEFIEPTLIGNQETAKDALVRSGDSMIFFNFREDSIRQLAQAFCDPHFTSFARPSLEGVLFVTMTQYAEGLQTQVAFPKEEITQPLGLVLAQAGKRQLRLAESEKAAHVTFFFNGLHTQPFPEEYWVIIPSPRTIHFDQVPELSSDEITNRLMQSMEEKVYDFILVNFANPDLIAHTGNLDAGLKVVTIMDRVLNRVARTALDSNVSLIVTADHGNLESMLNPLTGMAETRHDPNPVPFYLIDQSFARTREDREIVASEKEAKGSLADVAPTILALMELSQPETMTGQSLLPYLR